MSWILTLAELEKAVRGQVLSRYVDSFTGVGTDSRQNLHGQVFIPLKGENFDAHDFLKNAVDAGAAAVLVHQRGPKVESLLKKVTVIRVPDTLLALQDLSTFWRQKMGAKILAFTGSNGKSTTKEFAATLIGRAKKVCASQGSLNNHWGVPISLLQIQPEHQIALIEMGMNHLHEIERLVQIAGPDVVGVTMVGRGHLEGMGSVENVARAKNEIYEFAPKNAQMFFNLDNVYTRTMHDLHRRRCPEATFWTFSSQASADVQLSLLGADTDSITVQGAISGILGTAKIPVFGAHNLTNVMAASCLALSAGLTAQQIWQGLPECHTGWGRNQWVKLKSGARALFDGYNANPESMSAALENFARLRVRGRRFAVLGEMKELGEASESMHHEIGARAAAAGFDGIYFFGPHQAAFRAGLQAGGFSKTLFTSDSYEENLASDSLPVLEPTDILLVKGSRGMQLEKVLARFEPVDFKAK